MRQYLQLHLLTSYPPANLNRDDLGRPKTAIIGGTTRLRISSQSLKRAWRTSDIFSKRVGSISSDGATGLRTKRLGEEVYKKLIDGGIEGETAVTWTHQIAGVFGAFKKEEEKSFPKNLWIEQLAFISPEERYAVFELVDVLIERNTGPSEKELKLLRSENSAADLALFGRMVAAKHEYNFEAAVQVAHAFSVQKIVVEDDFFTAVDDLNRGEGEEDMGAGHMGVVEFASGIFYTYINIDRRLLLKNLEGSGDRAETIWENAMRGIVESSVKVAPTGMQNSFGSRAYSHYVMAEMGNQQPRSLALAFADDVKHNHLSESIHRIEDMKTRMDAVYGPCSDESFVMNVLNNQGTYAELEEFCVKR